MLWVREWSCNLSGCRETWTAQLQNILLAARPNLQDSCSFSGLLKFIFCLCALEQTPMKAVRNVLLAWFPPLPSLLSSPLCSPRTQLSPCSLPSHHCWVLWLILSLILWSLSPFHQHVMPLFPSLATFFIHLGVLALQIQTCKENKSSFPSTCSPFSSDFKPWEWHTVLP